MKKKVIFAVATGLFALATVFNMNVLQSNSAGDVSLESIAVMAQANLEGGHTATYDCVDAENWTSTKETGFFGNRFRDRICSAPGCGRNWHNQNFPSMGTCTVNYN